MKHYLFPHFCQKNLVKNVWKMSYLARGSKFRIQRRCQRSCRINKNLLKEAACIYNQYSINCYFFTTQVKYWEIKIIIPHWVAKPEKKRYPRFKIQMENLYMKIAFHNVTYYLPMNPKPTFDGAKWPSKDTSKPTYSFRPFHMITIF